jgi:hypothetical protein
VEVLEKKLMLHEEWSALYDEIEKDDSPRIL